MLEQDTPILHTVTGRFFEAMVWRCEEPPEFRAFIRIRDTADGAELFDTGFDVGSAHLEELRTLAATTSYIIGLLTTLHAPPSNPSPTWPGDPSPN